MKNVKISELNNESLFDLVSENERLTLVVDDVGISKESIPTLNEILRVRSDFFINITPNKSESNKNNIKGDDLLKSLPNMQNLIYYASLKHPLNKVDIFSRLIKLRSLHLYGNLVKDINLKPLDNIPNLESVYIENGLTLKQDVYLERRKEVTEIGAGTFRMESFTKNENLKKIAVLSSMSSEEQISKKLPSLEHLYLEKGKNIRSFDFISQIKTLKTIELNDIQTMTEIPNLDSIEGLEKIILRNLRNLENIDSVIKNPNIKILILENVKCFNTELLSKESAPKLRYVSSTTSDKAWDKKVKLKLEEKGFEDAYDS